MDGFLIARPCKVSPCPSIAFNKIFPLSSPVPKNDIYWHIWSTIVHPFPLMLVNLEKCLVPLNGAIYRPCRCLQQKYAWSSITFMARAGNLSLSHRRRTIIDHLFSFTNDLLIASKLTVRTRRHFRYVEENSWGAMGEYSRRNRHNWSADILFPHGCSPHLDTAVEVVGDVRDVCIIGRIGGWDRCIFLSFQFGFCCLRRKLPPAAVLLQSSSNTTNVTNLTQKRSADGWVVTGMMLGIRTQAGLSGQMLSSWYDGKSVSTLQ